MDKNEVKMWQKIQICKFIQIDQHVPEIRLINGIKFPATKQDIQTYVEQNKRRLITAKIEKLLSKEYTSIQELVNEMSR
jgi:hypothetical protein